MNPWRSLREGDRGSVGAEAAIAGPALLILLAIMVFAGRLMTANGVVEQAAVDAARAASLERSAAAAEAKGESMAEATLAAQGLNCSSVYVYVDVSGFSSPPGTPANVDATVMCHVDVSDLSIPGVPGVKTVKATAVSPLDTFRERS